MKREEMLKKAKETVCGRREQDYGSPEDNFAIIADYWNTYLMYRDGKLSGEDVANMMCLFKLGRITTGTGTEDSYVDLAGYAACGAEIATSKDNKQEEECDEDSCPIF